MGRRNDFAAGLDWRLDGAAFADVAQARPFVEPAAWPRLAPLLTVHGAARPDPAAAPHGLAEALLVPRATPRPTVGDVVRVTAVARRDGRGAAELAALARIGREGWRILAWRPGRAAQWGGVADLE